MVLQPHVRQGFLDRYLQSGCTDEEKSLLIKNFILIFPLQEIPNAIHALQNAVE